MSKQASQSSDWNFNVQQIQLRHPITQALLGGQFGNFRDDTGECLGTTSEQYGIIQNVTLMDMAREALSARGLSGYVERVLSTGDRGQRFFAEFTFADKNLAMDVGDVFGYRLLLKNSFDRSLRASFTLGFLRLTCKNGASTLEKDVSVTRKHSSKVSLDFLGEAIDKAMANGKHALRVYDEMASVGITDEQGKNILNHLVLLDNLSQSLREEMETLWMNPIRREDKARNLFNLYNAVSEHLTHKVSGERFEYSEKVSNIILMRLANAARNPATLSRIIIPPAEKNVIVTIDSQVIV